MMYQFFRFFTPILAGCFLASGQPPSEIGYTVPLYNINDRTGKTVAQIIDVELTKMAIDKKLGALKKLPFEIDTAFRCYYQQDSVARIDEGFLDPASVCRRLYGPNIIPKKLLLVYDVTAHHVFDRWKGWIDPSNYVPGVYSGGIILENIAAGTPNDFDSLWCKVSLIDCGNPSRSIHTAIVVNDSTCDGKPVECIVETLRKIGRKPDPQSGRPSLGLVRSPGDQHWGKIIGGSALFGGGIFFTILCGIMEPQFRPISYLGAGAMITGGATILTIGIIKQTRYYRTR
ncbi:MAG: hypothetical protein JW913_09145 [Chitinispirillaceae bacterium]|nr:hypothetical protein [Chitinispirillaceae bacterium]